MWKKTKHNTNWIKKSPPKKKKKKQQKLEIHQKNITTKPQNNNFSGIND